MSSITEQTWSGSIKPPEEMLALWRQVEVDIAETGQSYRSPGGVEVTLAELGMVQKQIRHWEKIILRRRGLGNRNIADLTTGDGDNRSTL